jgi:hypothetical protein
MDAAQVSPSTVKGANRAVAPDSPCDRTSSYACWYKMTAATMATAITASAVVIRMSRSVTDVLPGEVGDAAGGWVAAECGVSPVMVVGVQPGVKGGAPGGF